MDSNRTWSRSWEPLMWVLFAALVVWVVWVVPSVQDFIHLNDRIARSAHVASLKAEALVVGGADATRYFGDAASALQSYFGSHSTLTGVNLPLNANAEGVSPVLVGVIGDGRVALVSADFAYAEDRVVSWTLAYVAEDVATSVGVLPAGAWFGAGEPSSRLEEIPTDPLASLALFVDADSNGWADANPRITRGLLTALPAN